MDDGEIRTLLDAEAARLASARDAVQRDRGDLQGERSTDPIADQALVEREVDDALLAEIEAELAEVDAARDRLDAGTYGTCAECDVAIDDDRLRAVPATRWCVAHEREAEILVEARYAEDVDSPPDATEHAGWEARHHLGLVPEDDSDTVTDDELAPLGAEERAMHVRRG